MHHDVCCPGVALSNDGNNVGVVAMMTISQEQHVTTWWASSDYLGHQAASRKCASFQAEEYQQRTLEKRKYNFSLKSLFDVKQKPKTRTDFFCDPSRFLVALFFPTGALSP